MRAKTLALCSTSVAILAVASSPAWAQTPPTDVPAKTAATGAGELEEIVVTGLRWAAQSAQTIKRDSDQIVDAIVSEDIGKLPDITASASLARLPGIQVDRGAGEAANVTVRGLPDLSTTYNGREIFTAENRFVAIQDFPAGGVAALEVYKSGTANLIEGGIGGQINVRSRRPFDFKGFELQGALNGIHTEKADKFDWNGNILLSDRWDTGIGEMGVLVNAAHTQMRFLDSTREQSLVIGPPPELTATVPFRYPDAQAVFFGQAEFRRPSVNAAFQWQPTDQIEIYVDGLYQGFRGRGKNRFMFSPLFGDPNTLRFSNVVLRNGDQLESATVSGANAPDGFQSAEDANTDTYQFASGAIYTGERLQLSADIAYTDSTFDSEQANVDFTLAGSPIRDVVIEGSGSGSDGGPSFGFRDFDLTDPNNFLFRGLFERRLVAKGDDIQTRVDLNYDTDLGPLRAVQVGLRFNNRSAFRESGARFSFQLFRGLRYPDLPLDFELSDRGFRGNSEQGVVQFITPSRDSIWENIDELRTLVGFPTGPVPFNPLETFDADEKAYAGYAQLGYEFDIGLPVSGLIGLRAVKTKSTVSGTSRESINGGEVFTPVTASNEYTDYLPNVSARVVLTDELQLRLAYTQTRTRPSFGDLNPSTILDPPSGECTINPQSINCFRTAFAGNPNLQPLTSDNYDASLEWYFARAGSATVALFRRDVQGFISRIVVEEPDPTFRVLRTDRPENLGDARLQGFEVGFSSFLDFQSLPQWARDFGIQANYTYIDAEGELSASLRENLPGRQRLAGVAKHAYNIVGMYERPSFSARLAYNYRDDYVISYDRIFELVPCCGLDDTRPLIDEGRGSLDFSASVTPMPNITIAFDAINVLGDPFKVRRPYSDEGDSFSRQRRYVERLYSLGIRFRF